MEFEVYCDESSPEVLWDKSANKYLVLGSVWIPSDFREELKTGIKEIKKTHNYRNEIKWNKVSPSSFDFYKALVAYFFSADFIRFRAIIVEADKIDKVKFHNDDSELSFYKFYYQLLHHWILDFNEYSIFIDHKVNKDLNRVHNLKDILNNANLFSSIKNLQALPSDELLGIQLADFLMGALNGKVNGRVTSKSKLGIIEKIEKQLNHEIVPTPKAEEKFNVFKINLEGGW
ncbi:DUF3800 domain-containing protein [Tenacibaculum finnmarkense]|uniref:DUF3800 domain-containing protein n=1 Tax=Tenacibaculum finnmarkense TaxID=2781243 RepID=UPI001EFB25A0|nr:DUF3800 domain-containing protein [Tenacibaculum finnmarkense]MCG8207300.1 DUF3800 domain-containing protein [Tenacibaculum finnmarkense genomovar finnmarkense]MCG8723471.1 DUF3800 domain-containing protein [Tenacibaculum finnmarkense]MCG8741888.1 DUF3800 domain-containing protein [Tenacibaculum finnmarkense]MCG8765135.1 DUF3800 domain-containing protein [Tenacibaculum finnmarkense]MCG8777966.1 DUF3800 domain-containing protein [Tenacibaculum finnmarkense]